MPGDAAKLSKKFGFTFVGEMFDIESLEAALLILKRIFFNNIVLIQSFQIVFQYYGVEEDWNQVL